jgi:hypothetical protein
MGESFIFVLYLEVVVLRKTVSLAWSGSMRCDIDKLVLCQVLYA